jgi:hypothetical protein
MCVFRLELTVLFGRFALSFGLKKPHPIPSPVLPFPFQAARLEACHARGNTEKRQRAHTKSPGWAAPGQQEKLPVLRRRDGMGRGGPTATMGARRPLQPNPSLCLRAQPRQGLVH